MVGVVPRKLDRLILLLLHIRRLFVPAPATTTANIDVVEKKKNNKVDSKDKTVGIPIIIIIFFRPSVVEEGCAGRESHLGGNLHKYLRKKCEPRSRFHLNVTAGSQKRAIANLRKSKGRDESRFALRVKKT
jgi:hypothetical protein